MWVAPPQLAAYVAPEHRLGRALANSLDVSNFLERGRSDVFYTTIEITSEDFLGDALSQWSVAMRAVALSMDGYIGELDNTGR
jgi:hypothetical protein